MPRRAEGGQRRRWDLAGNGANWNSPDLKKLYGASGCWPSRQAFNQGSNFQKLVKTAGFTKIPATAEPRRLLTISLGIGGRHDQHGNVSVCGIFPDARQNLAPRAFRQIEIQNKQIRQRVGGAALLHPLHRFLAIRYYLQFRMNLMGGEGFLNQENVRLVVFYHHDAQPLLLATFMPGR